MNIKSDMWQVASDKINRTSQSCHVSRVTCHPQNGMALVITLILLSVTLIMAVAFLSISRRERNSVTTTTDTASARLAADAALANAEAQIVAGIFATTNVAAYNFGLLVSTNYINGLGFQTGVANPTNVNYNYPNGNPVTGNDLIQNIANLFYLPRAPVLVSTNRSCSRPFLPRPQPQWRGPPEWIGDERGQWKQHHPGQSGQPDGHRRSWRPGMDWRAGPPGCATRAEQPVCIALRLHRRARRQHPRHQRHS